MKYPTGMLLDEFTNFGKIANIADVLSIIRKAKISLVLGFQNYHQLERVYSPNEARIIIDQPATQIYFRQKNFHEARVLSDALGKTTIEEVTVSDSGRVQEFIQGRALATPEELINLKDQVIAFTNDTWPLKLPVASPVAYQHAMDYPPPERPIHSISETVQRRGRNCAPMNDAADAEDPNPEKGGRNKKGNGAGAGKQSTPEVDPQLDPTVQPSDNTNTNSNPSQERPEVDDIWSY